MERTCIAHFRVTSQQFDVIISFSSLNLETTLQLFRSTIIANKEVRVALKDYCRLGKSANTALQVP